MNELQIFNSEEFGEIRTVTIGDEPWFVGKDIAEALGYAEPRSAVSKRVEAEDRGVAEMETPSGKQNMTIINESGLYSLILGSKLESAKRFKRWVTSEVLPAIHHNGGYIAGQENLSDAELMAKAILVAQKTIEHKNQIITGLKDSVKSLSTEVNMKNQIIGELKPKADYYDEILKNPGLVTITQIAKDYGMSGKKMNEVLHDIGIQYKQSDQWLLYSKYHDMGYTHSHTVDITRSDGRPDVKMTTKWTQKGRIFLYGKLKENGILPMIEQEETS